MYRCFQPRGLLASRPYSRSSNTRNTVPPSTLARGARTERKPCGGMSSGSCGTAPLDTSHSAGPGSIRAALSMPALAASVRKHSQLAPDVREMADDSRLR